MPNERDLKAEIGHVLFIDLVGYSKLLINEQSEVLHELNAVVRGTERVQAADAAGKLIRLPAVTGWRWSFAVAAQMGEPDRAIAALQKLISIPYGSALAENVPLTPALLRLDPMFDPLRSDPRFQKLCKDKRR